MTKLTAFQSEWLPKIEQQLKQDLAVASRDSDFSEMMAYAVLNGGKRLRPMLTLAVVASFGQKITPSILKVATAVEWVHAYSLVHDDLPAMDNDLFRRGKPSVHARYGEAEAILVGDALLTGAFHVVSSANSTDTENENIAAEELLLLSQMLSYQAGAFGMVIGQVGDMKNHRPESKNDVNWLLNDVYAPKTAALLGFSAIAGSRLSHLNSVADNREIATSTTNSALLTFGIDFGMAFQIQDDLDDFDQDNVEKITSLPHLIGIEGASEKRDEYLTHARQTLTDLATRDLTFDRTLLDDFLNVIGDDI
ncbi:polyprenyl synthetase family protein [Leuconostoc gelidum subsp. aenigmaticum]|uniref:polyprenyl synthetase family protein n=1 Tax=Leuconostoc gelidum TaxID=1244 RepID=UPI001CC82643|nr:polyprenyl synthetase family protein [Leuconostoc gelidum]MBZ6002488.1 polyprenyl synthetase family protein [Leuconostoc gelidum subsp. aenigmaticum]